jgi:septum formation protein
MVRSVSDEATSFLKVSCLMKKIILASASPRRRELLRQIGLIFAVVPSEIEEDVKDGEEPREHVLRLARIKAQEIARDQDSAVIIAADTIVVLGGEILGKPKDEEEAFEMLSRLSGRVHRVFTGFCVLSSDGSEYSEAVESKVRFKHLTPEEIRGYIKTGEPMDKAGAYAVQGRGSYMIKKIQGSYTNVVGLPLCELVEVLVRFGAIELYPNTGS